MRTSTSALLRDIVTLIAFGVSLAVAAPATARNFRCESGDTACLVRSIKRANRTGQADSIYLAPGAYTLTRVDNVHDYGGASGLPVISTDIRIIGDDSIIQRDPDAEPFRIFHIWNPGVLTLDGLTIRYGYLDGDEYVKSSGGAILALGRLNLLNSSIVENRAGNEGGGIFSSRGKIFIDHSMIARNEATWGGGLLDEYGPDPSEILITNSTVYGNRAWANAGIDTASVITIVNTTIADNVSDLGVGGFNGGLRATNCTITGNRGRIGGVRLQDPHILPALAMTNTILAGNSGTVANDCSGAIVSEGNNLFGDVHGCDLQPLESDIFGDPRLDSFLGEYRRLPDYGHFPLLPDSPAIDAGDDALCPPLDTLGRPRYDGNGNGLPTCDIGAAEYQGVAFEEARLAPEDTNLRRYGRTVAATGRWAFVGDDGQDPGVVYVFEFDRNQWKEVDRLVAEPGDSIGNGMYADSDVLVVDGPRSSSTYIYRFNGERWQREAKLRHIDPALDGTSVGVSGDIVVVSSLQRNPGRTYVYEFDGETWQHAATLTVPDASSIFGHCAVDGETIVVGDTANDFVSVFGRENGRWREVQRLKPSDNPEYRINFGLPVRIDGNTLAVGAVWDYETSKGGATYVYERQSRRWKQVAKLLPEGPDEGLYFGFGLDLKGETLIVGATAADGGPESGGAAYLYDRVDGRWVPENKLIRRSTEAWGQAFGTFVALTGDMAVVGEHPGNLAWVYQRTDQGPKVVDIDFMPGSNRNAVDPASPSLVPVVIFSAEDFDALQTDLTSLSFNPGAVPPRSYRVYDANRDGLPDLVPHVRVRNLVLGCGVTEVAVTGKTHGGVSFYGFDVVTNKRCP